MQERRQALVNKNQLAANARRVDHDWRVGDQVYVVADDGAKLAHSVPTKPEPVSNPQLAVRTILNEDPGCLHLRFQVLERIASGFLATKHEANWDVADNLD